MGKKDISAPGRSEGSLFCNQDQWCGTMNDRLHDEANTRRAGMSVTVTTNMATGKNTVQGISFHKNAADRGLLLHWCPWCGTDLYKLSGLCKPEKDCHAERGKA